ncbi:hypothetical protein KRE40_13510 [Elizabethkingia meningoseptica]|uniref:hypothetical protein n=1 Tax=Elizabethkingia meningoseptica TaxID=238 RepID=UPI00099AF2C5|nr:hypothetical protein [Elizabethkingia meningoseptica]MDE5437208.1 hypothetical protein [Elizabethkingia meningoseptica]MDE5466575.1 hypothetical protein [Elizabethkingia meningoseptica]MDE5474195.1 hypothetical protein [Elizabethkingia meningoseptica]MDE5477628.1 hypothetical protein [Elizabethkingia meningoseptica]MDE5483894.1 hypothetical protein [Elizabethkingia meningoseptica]
MKHILAIFVFFTLVFRPVLPLIDYGVNYDYIVSKLCENRTKPQVLCNGKCYLVKELAKTSDTMPKQENQKISIGFIDVFISGVEYKIQDITHYISKRIKPNTSYTTFYNFLIESKIFHPPLI